jgi:adenylate kinase
MDSIVLMGPPGAGKGTQAKFLTDTYGFCHLSTGDLVRKEMAQGTELGLKIKSIVTSGRLPSDEDIYSLLEKEIKKVPLSQGIIFDGFPRRVAQAHYLEGILKSLGRELKYVIFIEVDRDVLIKRITGRLSCKNCKASYNLYYKKPRVEGTCDSCHSTNLEKRSDDNTDSLINRLSEYEGQTLSIADYYKNKGILHHLNGESTEEEVSLSLKKLFD